MSCLADKIKFKGHVNIEPDTYEQFMLLVDCVIGRVLPGLSSLDLADTVFTRDAFDEKEHPVDVAEDILNGDTIGQMALESFLGGE